MNKKVGKTRWVNREEREQRERVSLYIEKDILISRKETRKNISLGNIIIRRKHVIKSLYH